MNCKKKIEDYKQKNKITRKNNRFAKKRIVQYYDTRKMCTKEIDLKNVKENHNTHQKGD